MAAGLAALTLASAGCGRQEGGAAPSAAQPETPTVALLLPESKTARYESHDRPHFERRVRELCAECRVIYSNADQDAAKQQNQAEAALTNQARVLVLDPVDSASAAAIVARAKQSKVPVVSYDRLVMGADVDYYVSFDNRKVGELQGQALLDRLTADGAADETIVIINGSPTDNNAKLYKDGAHSVLDDSGLVVGAEYDTPDWSPDKAQQQMEQAITKLGGDRIAGVYAANDGTAGGAIAAMKAAGIARIPPVTGQDAELAAVQRIVAGEQYMTVYKAMRMEAEAAAELAVALVRGATPAPGAVNGSVNNGFKDVPAILLAPLAVTQANVRDTVIADGFWTAEQVCAGYEAACAAAGIR
jgi:D-xylose transport system substrate-binding protein